MTVTTEVLEAVAQAEEAAQVADVVERLAKWREASAPSLRYAVPVITTPPNDAAVIVGDMWLETAADGRKYLCLRTANGTQRTLIA